MGNEAAELAFTYKELNNPAFIVRNKERAIRHLSFFHNLLNLYQTHADYYQTKADASVRGTLYNLLEATDYVNYSSFRIQQALLIDGMGADGLFSGDSTMNNTASIPYMRGYDYKTIMAENKMIAEDLNYLQATNYARHYADSVGKMQEPEERTLRVAKNNNKFVKVDTPLAEYIELKLKYGRNKKEFTAQQREELLKSTLEELSRTKGKGKKKDDERKRYNEMMDERIARYRRLDKGSTRTSNHECLRDDITHHK